MHHVLLDLGRFIWDNLPVRLVTICGTVTRTTDIKPELLVATWRCNDCRREISGVAQEFKVTYPPRCPTKHCGNTTNWKLLAESRSTRWGNWQRVRLQENENEVPAGSMPQTMDVIVRDEQTERCKAGDKVQITGSLIVVPDVPTLMSPSELRGNVRRSLKTRSDPSYAAGEGVRGLKSVGNRDLTYKLAFYGTYIDEVCLLRCSWLILVGYGWKELEFQHERAVLMLAKSNFRFFHLATPGHLARTLIGPAVAARRRVRISDLRRRCICPKRTRTPKCGN